MVGCLLLVGALATATLAADIEVVVPSGARVSGDGITRFRDPVAAPDGTILFRGTTEAITVPDDADGVRVLVRSGTVPPGRGGESINSILAVESTRDARFVAFQAELNGTAADQGLFVLEADQLTTIAARRVDAGARLTAPDMNAAGDLTFATEAGVFRRLRADGQTTLVIPAGTGGPPRRPRIDGSGGALIWLATDPVSGGTVLRHWSEGSGTRTVFEGAVNGAAVDATGGVAFIVRRSSEVLVWDPVVGETHVLAREGDETDAGAIQRIRNRIEFRADGSVVFQARVRRNGWVVAANGTLTFSRSSGIGTSAVAIEVRDGLHRWDGGRLTTIARTGDVLPGVGGIEALGRAVPVGGTTVVAMTAGGRPVLTRTTSTGLARVVADGDFVSGAGLVGVFGVGEPRAFDAEDRTVAFLSGTAVVVLRPGRPARVLEPPTPRGGEGTFSAGRVVVRAGQVFVLGGFESGRSGLFVSRGRRLRPLVLTTDSAPVASPASFGAIDLIGRAAGGVVFDADAGSPVRLLFLWTRGRVFRLATEALVDGAPAAALPVESVAAGRGGILFTTADAIYRASPAGALPVAANGETTALGMIGIGLDSPPTVAVARRTGVFAATLTGGSVRAALLARALE